MKTEEKFVTIPYDVWNDKYKPMEQELDNTKQALYTEKESKKIDIYLKFYSSWFKRDERYHVGTIDWDLRIPKKVIEKGWYPDIERGLVNFSSELLQNHYKLVSKEELQMALEKIERGRNAITKIAQDNYEKVKKLPKIVKWLFKIKSIWE